MNENKEECNCYGCTTMRYKCVVESYENNEEIRNEMLEVYMDWAFTDINKTNDK